MDPNDAVKRFQKLKVVTIEQLVSLLESSVITARRQLKKWRAYTSFNMNGRYYTLPGIPQFDENGIWEYQRILFSKYGTLTQTISRLAEQGKSIDHRVIHRFLEHHDLLKKIQDTRR